MLSACSRRERAEKHRCGESVEGMQRLPGRRLNPLLIRLRDLEEVGLLFRRNGPCRTLASSEQGEGR